MQIHCFFSTFLCLAVFFTPVKAQQPASPLLQELDQKWTNAANYTREVAESMPDSLYSYKPVAEQMSFAEQIRHLADNILWLSNAYLGQETSREESTTVPGDKTALLALLDKALSQGQKAIRNIQTEALEEKVTFFAGNMSKRQIIILMNDHLTHHRAQAIVYLRLQGIAPPRYRGW